MTQRYVSKFGPVELIFLSGFAFLADAFNIFTLFLLSPVVNGAMFIILKLVFGMLQVKGSVVSLVGFVSPTGFVVVTYMMERAKERSPLLAKADGVASGGPSVTGK